LEFSKQRVVSLSLLGLGIAAFTVDRFALGNGVTSPTAASAASLSDPAQPATGAKADSRSAEGLKAMAAGSRPDSLVSRINALSQRMSEEDSPSSSADAFRAPVGWFKVEESTASAAAPSRSAESLKYHVTSVIDGKSALINGVTLQVGQERDKGKLKGVRLVSVDKAGVIIEVGGVQHRLDRREGKEAEGPAKDKDIVITPRNEKAGDEAAPSPDGSGSKDR